MRCRSRRTTNSGAVLRPLTWDMMALRFSGVNLSGIHRLGFGSQERIHTVGDLSSEQGRNGVADLLGYLDLAPTEVKVVRKGLEASSLPVGDWAVLFRMQIASLFRFKKLGTDS